MGLIFVNQDIKLLQHILGMYDISHAWPTLKVISDIREAMHISYTKTTLDSHLRSLGVFIMPYQTVR